MSYPHYTQPGNQQQPPTSATYPYGAYHPPAPGPYGHPHPQSQQGYPNPYAAPGPYQTGVTGYGWPYQYSYIPQQQQQQHPQSTVPRPAVQATQPVAVQGASTSAIPPAPQRSTTFTSYTPSYLRESVTAASTGGATGRGSRKQSNFKGLFTKEREYLWPIRAYNQSLNAPSPVKNLMYGFGDDRNPANYTVNVMEEILVEFITDVVRHPVLARFFFQVDLLSYISVNRLVLLHVKAVFRLRTCVVRYHDQPMPKNSPGWKNYSSCKKT